MEQIQLGVFTLLPSTNAISSHLVPTFVPQYKSVFPKYSSKVFNHSVDLITCKTEERSPRKTSPHRASHIHQRTVSRTEAGPPQLGVNSVGSGRLQISSSVTVPSVGSPSRDQSEEMDGHPKKV